MSRRLSACALFCAALAGGSFWMRAQQVDTRQLSALLPPGALLYLEAKDFRSLLARWNSSSEKQAWLASDNFGVLSRSRLVRRLAESQAEFAGVAGVPIELNLLKEVAGGRSAFAFYNLPSLNFVYLTSLDSSRLNTSELWRSRARYEHRTAAGIPFYVKSQGTGDRTVSFAAFHDWLVIATAERQMAETLALLAGEKGVSLGGENWFIAALGHAAAQGDLRLVYRLDKLLPTPQFRTYWLQQNTSDLKEFSSGVADLFETPAGFEEQRVLLRASPKTVTNADASLNAVLQYVPPATSLYRAWSLPGRDLLKEVLQQVILGESGQSESLDRLAPQVSLATTEAGAGSDFETRIDQAPRRRAETESVAPLVDAVLAMQPVALLHVQTTRELGDNVFIVPESGLVLECRQPDLSALEKLLPSVAGPLQAGALDPLRASLTGHVLILSRLAITHTATAPRLEPGTTYAAFFNKEEEWPHYKRLFTLVDRRAVNPEAAASPNAPPFFSGNLRSLGDTLGRLRSVSITAADQASQMRETLRYETRNP